MGIVSGEALSASGFRLRCTSSQLLQSERSIRKMSGPVQTGYSTLSTPTSTGSIATLQSRRIPARVCLVVEELLWSTPLTSTPGLVGSCGVLVAHSVILQTEVPLCSVTLDSETGWRRSVVCM
jgi:hypothetical protein